MKTHASHRTRVSLDASSYDEICDICHQTDADGGKRLSRPCPGPDAPIESELERTWRLLKEKQDRGQCHQPDLVIISREELGRIMQGIDP